MEWQKVSSGFTVVLPAAVRQLHSCTLDLLAVSSCCRQRCGHLRGMAGSIKGRGAGRPPTAGMGIAWQQAGAKCAHRSLALAPSQPMTAMQPSAALPSSLQQPHAASTHLHRSLAFEDLKHHGGLKCRCGVLERREVQRVGARPAAKPDEQSSLKSVLESMRRAWGRQVGKPLLPVCNGKKVPGPIGCL